MKCIRLTPRLAAVAALISFPRVADVGTDHGKLLIALHQENRLKKGIGSDVAEGPALACRTNVRAYNCEDTIEIRVGDGLSTLEPLEADTLVLAGMGGELILKILSEQPQIVRCAKELVLQPMTNIQKLLVALPNLNLKITKAVLAKEGEKLYQIFRCENGNSGIIQPIDTLICPLLRADPLCGELLAAELKKCKKKLAGLQKSATVDLQGVALLQTQIKELENYEIK